MVKRLALLFCEYHSDGTVCQRITCEFMTVSSRARQGEEDASLHDVLRVDGHMPDEIGLWCPAGHPAADDVGQVGDADCIHGILRAIVLRAARDDCAARQRFARQDSASSDPASPPNDGCRSAGPPSLLVRGLRSACLPQVRTGRPATSAVNQPGRRSSPGCRGVAAAGPRRVPDDRTRSRGSARAGSWPL